jgi:hypothetical protein
MQSAGNVTLFFLNYLYYNKNLSEIKKKMFRSLIVPLYMPIAECEIHPTHFERKVFKSGCKSGVGA